ncbi:MAG: hypothetical protein LBI54_10805 [Lachnospiraceae bacterium]|jgi:hypothetical protein|nr:hypothetical protein [Lachnospiraceae bacterium]
MDNAISIMGVNSVTGVQTEHASGTNYTISFMPDFTFSGTGRFTGSFYVKLVDGRGGTVSSFDPLIFTGIGASYSLTDVAGLSPGEIYGVMVSGNSGFTNSKTGFATTSEYAAPRAVLRNGALTVKWAAALDTFGELDVGGDWHSAMPIPTGAKGYTLPLSPEIYGDAHFTLCVAACTENGPDDTSVGPFSAPIDAYLAVPAFTAAELAGGVLTVSSVLPAYIANQYTVLLGLALPGEEPDIAALLSPRAGAALSYDVSAYSPLEGYVAYLFVASKAATTNGEPVFANYNITPANTFALSNPKVWRKGYYSVDITSGTATKTLLLYAESQAALEGNAAIAYQLPLYVDFQSGKSIAVDGLSLAKSGDGLALTVDRHTPLTAAAFKQFLAQLSDPATVVEAIEPAAYYALRDIARRVALFDKADAAYILHGIGMVTTSGGSEIYRYEDLFPGSVLRVRTAGFRRQTDPKAEALEGYYQNSELDYYAEYNQAANRLDFEANLSLLVDTWSYCAPELSPAAQEIFGGAMDFSLASIQKPYARVISTRLFFPSGSLDDGLGAPTGMSMFFADDLATLNDVTDLDAPAVPNLAFRGRAALTVGVTVFFGTSPVVVPAGTTLGAFAARYGIGDIGKASLKRRGHDGELVSVHAPLAAFADLPLLNGDMLA